MEIRSILYNLEPISVGTADVECLTSYLSRLARAHSVRFSTILNHYLLPNINSEYHRIQGINGHTDVTYKIIGLLNQLTGRRDLKELTLLRYKNVISNNKLLKRKRKWCSLCWEEQINKKTPIYDKLIWHISCVTSCLKHNVELSSNCIKCKAEQPIIHSRLINEFCYKCFSFLGCAKNIKSPSNYDKEIDLLITRLFKDNDKRPLDINITRKGLSYIKYNLIPGNKRSFMEEYANINYSNYKLALSTLLPGINFLSELSYCFKIPIIEILHNEIKLKRETEYNGMTNLKSINHFDYNKVKLTIEDLIQKMELQNSQLPTNWVEIAEIIGNSKAKIKSNFPDLYNKMIEINERRREEQSKKLLLERFKAIEDCMEQILNKGEYPSRRRVAEELPFVTSFNNIYYKKWKQTKIDLGI